MEFIKKVDNKITVKVEKSIELEEKTYSMDFLNKKIPELQKEYDRRQASADKIKMELDKLTKIKAYGEKESNSNKLG